MTDQSNKTESEEPKAGRWKKRKKDKGGLGGWVQRTFLPVKEISDTAGMTKNMFEALVEGNQKARTETFEEAINRQNLGPDDLYSAYQRQRGGAILFLVIAALAALYLIYLLITAASTVDVAIAVLGLGPLSVLLTASFRSSFRAWQIRNRRLGGLKEFQNSRDQWWPVEIPKDHFASGAKTGRKVATRSKKPAGKPAKKGAST
ncbi:MAG: hypothetical protein KI792_03645 [Alphaproteobacteria bacterium]|nr:hypothetical protein [Alphaproteobacteria bacterium SS10]